MRAGGNEHPYHGDRRDTAGVRRRFTALAAAITTLAALLSGLPDPTAAGFQANLNGLNWSGYAAVGAGYRSLAATWSMPTVTCTSRRQVVGAWVGLGGIASDAVEQTGSKHAARRDGPHTGCGPSWQRRRRSTTGSGRAGRRAQRAGPALPRRLHVDRDRPLAALDRDHDRTRHRRQRVRRGDRRLSTRSLPGFDRFSFTDATVDGHNLSAARPAALDAANGAHFQDHTTPLNATTFTVTSRSATG